MLRSDVSELIDDLDRALVERLRVDGRESNRSLANALGINEATVANRLRRMESSSIMRVVALADMEAFGYAHLGFAKITVRDRPVSEVGADLAKLVESIVVTIATGRYDLIVAFLARDRAHLAETLGKSIPSIKGVDETRCELALEVLRYDSMWGVLDAPDWPFEPWEENEAVDRLDLAIIRELQKDARVSNRRIAAELDVSEGTIRSRIRRMEDEKLIRIQAVSDPFAFGFTSHAYVGVEAVPGKIDEVAKGLLEIDSVFVLTRTLGEFDFLALCATGDRESLIETVLNRIRPLKGVRRTETIENWAALKHAYLWARLV